jgi:iron-sulfur cluster assembly protein
MSDATFPLEFTAAALEHLHKQLAKKPAGTAVRLSIKTAGCSGLQYKLDFVDAPVLGDQECHLSEQLMLYLETKSIPFIQGTVVDYVKEGLNAHFKFINPVQKGSCGCGESFYV